MCGIVGLLAKNGRPIDEGVLAAMTRRLAHRGPDGEGTWHNADVGIGHRRLAIIDPNAGHQPMSSPDGRMHITYNGEVYNYRELRKTLESHGHRFRTESDTEVVLTSYRQWGTSCVHRFRGMFAFGIVDLEEAILFLARDHLGIKPLVYYHSPRFFAFSSEIQALRVIPEATFDVNLDAIDDYLQLLYIPGSQTAYQWVHKLKPGHTMIVRLDGGVGRQQSYWRPTFDPNRSRSEEEWIEGLDEVLRESVRAHLVSDVPFGAFLSGGLDSSAVVAYMSQILDRPVTAFTIGFEDGAYDEVPAARRTADQWGAQHQVETLNPDALGILPDLVRHYGEPFGDTSAIPTFFLSKLAAGSVPMVLSGDGGDEIFAGYRTYAGWLQWLHWDGRPRWRRWLYPLARRLRPRRYPPRKPCVEAWLRFVNPTASRWRRVLWKEDVFRPSNRIPALFSHEYASAEGLDSVQIAQYLDLRTYLPNDILTKVDIASMMSSLEVRTPLVDHRVIDFVSSIPPELNIGRNDSGVFEGKLMLKRLLSRYYPENFVRQPKKGFSAPVSLWFGADGTRAKAIQHRLLDPCGPLAGIFDLEGVISVIQSGSPGMTWQLLFLDEWLRQQHQ